MKQDKAYIEMQVTDAPLSEQEFEELVKRMRPQLMRMGREFFGSEMEAEEVVQETWLRVWNVRHSATVTEALRMDEIERGTRNEVTKLKYSGGILLEVGTEQT